MIAISVRRILLAVPARTVLLRLGRSNGEGGGGLEGGVGQTEWGGGGEEGVEPLHLQRGVELAAVLQSLDTRQQVEHGVLRNPGQGRARVEAEMRLEPKFLFTCVRPRVWRAACGRGCWRTCCTS